MPRRLERSSSLCSRQERKRQDSTTSYAILRDFPFVQKSRFSIYASKAPRKLFDAQDEYERYVINLSIRYYNVWKRTSSAAFPHGQETVFMAAIAEKLKAASIRFRRPYTVGKVHPTSRAIATIAQEQINHPPSQPENSSQALVRHSSSTMREPSVASSIAPSRHVSVISFVSRNSSVATEYYSVQSAAGPSRHISVTSHVTSLVSGVSFFTASSGLPDRISRTRPSFEGSRWKQTIDSTTVSGFSNLQRAGFVNSHGLGQAALLSALESREEKDREESEERDEGDSLLRRFRKVRIGRKTTPAGMLKAMLRQRAEEKIAVVDEPDISRPVSPPAQPGVIRLPMRGPELTEYRPDQTVDTGDRLLQNRGKALTLGSEVKNDRTIGLVLPWLMSFNLGTPTSFPLATVTEEDKISRLSLYHTSVEIDSNDIYEMCDTSPLPELDSIPVPSSQCHCRCAHDQYPGISCYRHEEGGPQCHKGSDILPSFPELDSTPVPSSQCHCRCVHDEYPGISCYWHEDGGPQCHKGSDSLWSLGRGSPSGQQTHLHHGNLCSHGLPILGFSIPCWECFDMRKKGVLDPRGNPPANHDAKNAPGGEAVLMPVSEYIFLNYALNLYWPWPE